VNQRLQEAFENKEVLKATVTKVLDGGLNVVVEDTRVFIPASLVSDTYEKNLKKYDGQEIEFVIIECNPRKRRIIGDNKLNFLTVIFLEILFIGVRNKTCRDKYSQEI